MHVEPSVETLQGHTNCDYVPLIALFIPPTCANQ